MLGQVLLEADPNISFAHKVNRLPFRLGGDVYKLSGGVMVAMAGVTALSLVNARTINMNGNAGSVNTGDILGVKGASVDGDPMRGAYGEIKITFNDTTALELFSLSAHTSESGLHNNSQQ